MTEKAKRTPKNAGGPFFVRADECLACCNPEAEAPDLMDFDEENYSCYFKRQPATLEETKQAVRAICVSCVSAVDYDGDNPLILKIRDQRRNSTGHTDWRPIMESVEGIQLDIDAATAGGE